MENANNIAAKPMYKCGICGKVYETIEERMNCEKNCLIREKENAKKTKEEFLKKQQENDKTKIEDEIIKLSKMLTTYKNKYNCDFSNRYFHNSKNYESIYELYKLFPEWFKLWY